MASPRQVASPVLTPTAFHDGLAPWALETPTPSMMNTMSMQKTASDPFRLRRAASLMPTPKRQSGPAGGVQASLEMAAGAADSAADGRVADRADPSAAAAMPRISRQLLREICQPFFEQMVQAVEDAFARRDAEGADGSVPRSFSDGEEAEKDVVLRKTSTDLEDYPFFRDPDVFDAHPSPQRPSLAGFTEALSSARSGDSQERAASEPGHHSVTDVRGSADRCTLADLSVESLMGSKEPSDPRSIEPQRERLDSFQTPSSISSASLGMASNPTLMSWQGSSTAASTEHRRERSDSFQIPSSISSASLGMSSNPTLTSWQGSSTAASTDHRRERSDSFQIPSSISSASLGMPSNPTLMSWQGASTAASDHAAECVGSAELGAGSFCALKREMGFGDPALLPTATGAAASLPHAAFLEPSLPVDGAVGAGAGSGFLAAPRSKGTAKKTPSHFAPGSKGVVCCHWRNKGWCRYQDKCKFAHPDHKRGVGISGASAGGSIQQQRQGRAAMATSQLQDGQLLAAATGYGISCLTLVPPSMQPLVAQSGCVYPVVAQGSNA